MSESPRNMALLPRCVRICASRGRVPMVSRGGSWWSDWLWSLSHGDPQKRYQTNPDWDGSVLSLDVSKSHDLWSVITPCIPTKVSGFRASTVNIPWKHETWFFSHKYPINLPISIYSFLRNACFADFQPHFSWFHDFFIGFPMVFHGFRVLPGFWTPGPQLRRWRSRRRASLNWRKMLGFMDDL